MKRLLVNILIFFSIVGVIDIAVGGIGDYLQHHAKGGEFRMFDDLVLKDKHDIIILGSSRAHCHYDTPLMSQLLDCDVYNAGYDGNGVVLSVGILDMILKRYSPKMVVFDVEPAFDIKVYSADNNHKRYLHRLKPYYNRSEIGRIFKDVSYEEWIKVHSGMIRYNTIIVPLAIDNCKNRGVEDKGFKPESGKMVEDRKMTHDNADVDEFKLLYINKMIELTKKHNVQLLLIASPKYGTENSSELSPIKLICEKSNIPFLDYYSDTTFVNHKELFKEPMHLNAEGAKLYSNMIANNILKYYKK